MEDELPRPRGDAASLLCKGPLDSYSQHELLERVAMLETEITRVKAQHDRAANQRALADSFFKSKDSG